MFCDIKYWFICEGNMYVIVVWNNNFFILLFVWIDIFLFFFLIVYFLIYGVSVLECYVVKKKIFLEVNYCNLWNICLICCWVGNDGFGEVNVLIYGWIIF